MQTHGKPLRRSTLAACLTAASLLATLGFGVPVVWATPQVTISAPQNNETVTNPSLTVQGTLSGITGTASGTVSVNGGTAQALTITGSTFSGGVTLSAGANTISVTVTDTNVQTGSTSATATEAVTLQTIPAVALTSATGSGGTITFSGTVSDTTVTQATVIYNGQALKTIPVASGDFSSYVTGVCGSPTLAVSATNGAGTGTSSTQTVSGLSACSSAAAAAGAAGGVPIPTAPAVSGLTPASGPQAGGTSVTIAGSGFTGATGVSFGAQDATRFTVVGDTEITAVAPAGTGTVDVTVTGLGGTSAVGTADRFTYTATAAAAPTVAFSDVPSSFWAYGSIERLTAAKVVDGFPDGTFRPNRPVTRAQFVKMLDLTLGLSTGGGATPFGDVSPGAWYAPYVAAGVRAGLIQGTSATTFSPNATVTREQMAVLLARGLHLSGGPRLSFSDAGSIDAWASAGVRAAVAAGYISGFPDGSFKPLGPTTRAQAAKVLALALSRRASSVS